MNKKPIIIAAVVSIILYLAGLFSGLAVSKELEKQQEEDFSFLIDYVSKLDNQLRSYQIQDLFINSLEEEDKCAFADTYFKQIANDLNYYWSIFPSRLEEYEKDRELSPEYQRLKDEYTKLSLRAWLVSRNNYQECGSNVVPILYFYSKDCEECIRQGEILDYLKIDASKKGLNMIVFTVDINQEEPSLDLIKKFYLINDVPAMVINERTIQGRLFSEEQISRELE